MNTVISLLLLYRFNYVHQETSYDIAKAMLERIDELPGLSVSDFASDLGTSITTVNRFCKELGFSSFKNLKIRLKATRKGRMGQIRERMSRITLELLLDDMERILKVSIDTVNLKSAKNCREKMAILCNEFCLFESLNSEKFFLFFL